MLQVVSDLKPFDERSWSDTIALARLHKLSFHLQRTPLRTQSNFVSLDVVAKYLQLLDFLLDAQRIMSETRASMNYSNNEQPLCLVDLSLGKQANTWKSLTHNCKLVQSHNSQEPQQTEHALIFPLPPRSKSKGEEAIPFVLQYIYKNDMSSTFSMYLFLFLMSKRVPGAARNSTGSNSKHGSSLSRMISEFTETKYPQYKWHFSYKAEKVAHLLHRHFFVHDITLQIHTPSWNGCIHRTLECIGGEEKLSATLTLRLKKKSI